MDRLPDIWLHICIWYNPPTLKCCSWFNSFMLKDRNPYSLHSQYRGCWRPAHTSDHGNARRGIDVNSDSTSIFLYQPKCQYSCASNCNYAFVAWIFYRWYGTVSLFHVFFVKFHAFVETFPNTWITCTLEINYDNHSVYNLVLMERRKECSYGLIFVG